MPTWLSQCNATTRGGFSSNGISTSSIFLNQLTSTISRGINSNVILAQEAQDSFLGLFQNITYQAS